MLVFDFVIASSAEKHTDEQNKILILWVSSKLDVYHYYYIFLLYYIYYIFVIFVIYLLYYTSKILFLTKYRVPTKNKTNFKKKYSMWYSYICVPVFWWMIFKILRTKYKNYFGNFYCSNEPTLIDLANT